MVKLNTMLNMIRNRTTEKDVREYLSQQGYFGSGARFDYLELFAIERPGWVQVFKFSAWAKSKSGDLHHLFGVVRDDERRSTKIRCVDTAEEQHQIAEEWSKGLIRGRRQPLTSIHLLLLFLFALVMFLVAISAYFSAR